ncbi:MAG: HdeD family acid-resistance protein [Huintestinicola sp.]
MNNIKNNINGIIFCIFEIIVGILLLINPIAFNTGIITIAGVVMLIAGLISVIKYFRTEADEAAVGQYLTKGLVALLVGVFCCFKSHWLIVTFPAVTIIYGLVVLVSGLGKIQLTCDLIRVKNKKWFLGAISALLSIICAVVILSNPFTSTTVLWMFTGIIMIVESIIDIITLIVSISGKTKE